MLTSLPNISFIVRGYYEALQWFTEVVGLGPRVDGSMWSVHKLATVGSSGECWE